MKWYYPFFIGILVILVVLGYIDDFTPDTVEYKCDSPFILNGTECCRDENQDGLCDIEDNEKITEYPNLTLTEDAIIFKTDIFNWGLYNTNSCTNCVRNPNLYDCSRLFQPLYFTCDIPTERTKMTCSLSINGEKQRDFETTTCNENNIIANSINLKPAQVSNVELCCVLTYWHVVLQQNLDTNEVCSNVTIQPACEL